MGLTSPGMERPFVLTVTAAVQDFFNCLFDKLIFELTSNTEVQPSAELLRRGAAETEMLECEITTSLRKVHLY